MKIRNVHFLLVLSLVLFSPLLSSAQTGAALDFDGVNDYVNIPNSNSLNLSKVTIETWIKLSSTAQVYNFICGKDFGQLEVHTNPAGGIRFIPVNYVYLDGPSGILPYDTWTHIALVYDPSAASAKLYVNGIEKPLINQGSLPLSTPIGSNTSPFSIGRRTNNSYYFKGALDEFRIWNRALTQAEIQSHMNCGLSGTQTNLSAYYKFNQGLAGANNSSATSLSDSSANGNNGTLNNFALNGNASNWIANGAIPNSKNCAIPIVYTFNGNGFWTDSLNWHNKKIPPTILPLNSEIIIDPAIGGQCILNVSQTINYGSKINILSAKKFVSTSDLLVNPDLMTIFTNISDPRFAEIITSEGQRVLFFGERNIDGSPKRLTGYSIQYFNDSTKGGFVTLDTAGRYSNIFLATGECLHFDYYPNDSVKTILSKPDSANNFFSVIEKGAQNNFISLNTSIKNNEKTLGADQNIDVKVVTKIRGTQIEKPVTGQETLVLVRLFTNNGDFILSAPYDANKGFFSLPLSRTGLNYHDENAIDKTVDFINKTLEGACADANSGNNQVDISIPELIAKVICPIPHPYATAVCIAANTILIACNAGKIVDILNGIANNLRPFIYKIDPNPIPDNNTEAAVTVSSEHHKYGLAYANQTAVSQILADLNEFDILITHEYTPEKPKLVVTKEITSIFSTSAITGGFVLDEGDSPISVSGVCWSTNPMPTISNNKTSNGSLTGYFSTKIPNLLESTKYYVRAYATNSAGTTYGNELSFTTTKQTFLLQKVSGDNQPQIMYKTLEPFTVKLTDDANNPIEGYEIRWSYESSTIEKDSINPLKSVTNQLGIASSNPVLNRFQGIGNVYVIARAYDNQNKLIASTSFSFTPPNKPRPPLPGTYLLQSYRTIPLGGRAGAAQGQGSSTIIVDSGRLVINNNLSWSSSFYFTIIMTDSTKRPGFLPFSGSHTYMGETAPIGFPNRECYSISSPQVVEACRCYCTYLPVGNLYTNTLGGYAVMSHDGTTYTSTIDGHMVWVRQ